MGDEAVKFWVATLKKVTETQKWQEQYIKRNLLTPVFWAGEEGNEYLDSLRAKYEKALKALGAIK
jgi:tripartite-type tricarboxylate transporter receptor subunit TctC